ncbi:hypothetical protein [Jatrophihabitans endophyticus]|uniref:hypothetical protein n=1 Tax=Jatrophihabitans endophyticus TaxID=1206085 RepID=UPI0019FD67BB|nr:hypothetical protein [Jatrophihabitans endophyticus]MBE7188598.1 hypothetical protein [Jatrophihabitans endophyticus]
MPIWFLYVFAALAVVAAIGRLVLGHGVVRGRSATPAEAVLVIVGSAGLAYHCGAMFFTASFTGVLGLDGYARVINMLGFGSVVAFAVPCALLLVGIRSTPLPYIMLVAASLVAVGVTMYDRGSLDAHLGAIMAAAVVIIGGIVLLGNPPGPRRGPRDVSGSSSGSGAPLSA